MGCNCYNAKSLFKDIWTKKVLDYSLHTSNKSYCRNYLLALLPSNYEFYFRPTSNFYTMMAFGGILAEGFLLSFTFIIISRSMQIKTHSKLKDYLRLSAIGLAILFASFFANPSAGSYLPFGVLSASFFAFGA
jgi:hypothetical protein